MCAIAQNTTLLAIRLYATGTWAHNVVVSQLNGALRNYLRGSYILLLTLFLLHEYRKSLKL